MYNVKPSVCCKGMAEMKRHFTLIVVSCIWLQRGMGGVVWDGMESKKKMSDKRGIEKKKKRKEMKTLEESKRESIQSDTSRERK